MDQMLVTTALEETWGIDEQLYFLGDWCMLYNRRGIWSKRSFKIQSYHWRNRKKFSKNSKYVDSLYEKTLAELTIYLNNYHNLDRPIDYWRIIIGPWLLSWIPILWDRWESVGIALKKGHFDSTIILKLNQKDMVPNDYNEFTHYFQQDIWNHWLYSEILKYRGFSDIIIKETNNIKIPKLTKTVSKIIKIISVLNRLLEKIPVKEKVYFSSSYFPIQRLFLLSLKLKQVPRFRLGLQNVDLSNIKRLETIRKTKISIKTSNRFEAFMENFVLRGIPVSYLEGFSSLKDSTKKIKSKAKIIITANGHFGDEVFKIWAAERKMGGNKLILSSHGGCIPSKYSMYEHQEEIADSFVVWNKPLYRKDIQLPPHKFVNLNLKPTKKGKVTLVGLDLPRYSNKVESGPVSSLMLDDYEQKYAFINELNSDVMKDLRIRPYYTDMGWDTSLRYIDAFGIEKICKEKNLYSSIVRSKIIICTYPQTTFLEAMLSGVPTILLYPEEYWEFAPIFNDLVQKLKKANIIFSNYKKAAMHLNKIANNPDEWWNKPETKMVKKYLHKMCGEADSDGLNKWALFFKKQIKETYKVA